MTPRSTTKPSGNNSRANNNAGSSGEGIPQPTTPSGGPTVPASGRFPVLLPGARRCQWPAQHKQEKAARAAPRRVSASEQRRASERLSKGRCGDPPYTALMRRLNESASWLSDLSGVSDDEVEASETRTPSAAAGDGGCLCLAEMLNESATWIDCDISGSDRDEHDKPGPPAPFTPLAGVQAAGVSRSVSY